MIDCPTKRVCFITISPFYLLILRPSDLNSEDTQVVPADDEDAVPDTVLPLLEQYPLNTTLGIGEPLTSDEVVRMCLYHSRCYSALC